MVSILPVRASKGHRSGSCISLKVHLEEEMGKLNIPIIRVETDYNEEDVEQLRIRIEAFIELIKYGGNDT